MSPRVRKRSYVQIQLFFPLENMELGKKKVQEFEFRGRQVGIERKIKRGCDQEGGGDTAGEK